MFILIIEFILPYLIIIFLISFMLHEGHNHHEGINNGLPRGMKFYPAQFMRFSHYDKLKIAHLIDTMHIRKNVNETLWQIIDGRRDKEKIVKICTDIQEANHAMQSVIRYSNRSDGVPYRNNLPWLLIEQQRNDVKEVIKRIKFPMGFSSNINNILTKKGEFGGVKTHYWNTFITVIILVYIFIYIGLVHLLFFFIFSLLLWSKQITIHFFVTVCSTAIFPKQL
jgi:hypothetical protein